MQQPAKRKGILVVIVFILLLVLPVTYGLIKNYLAKHTAENAAHNNTSTRK